MAAAPIRRIGDPDTVGAIGRRREVDHRLAAVGAAAEPQLLAVGVEHFHEWAQAGVEPTRLAEHDHPLAGLGVELEPVEIAAVGPGIDDRVERQRHRLVGRVVVGGLLHLRQVAHLEWPRARQPEAARHPRLVEPGRHVLADRHRVAGGKRLRRLVKRPRAELRRGGDARVRKDQMGRLVEVVSLDADFEIGALLAARRRQHEQPSVGEPRGRERGRHQQARKQRRCCCTKNIRHGTPQKSVKKRQARRGIQEPQRDRATSG